MEQYKKIIQSKLFLSIGVLICPFIMISAISSLGWIPFSKDIAYIQIGLFIALLLIALFTMIKYIRSLCNAERLKKLFVKENDERTNYISNKTATLSFYIAIATIGVVTILMGYMNETAFYTLLCVLVFLTIIHVASTIYYKKKY